MSTANVAAKPAARRGRRGTEPEKRTEALLDAATEVFLEAGFSGAKMSAIAKRAGSSMETLYARYSTKAQLFAALIERKTSSLLDALGPLGAELEPREALTTYAVDLLTMMTKPDTQKLHRLVIAGCIQSPELGRMFWEAGPGRGFETVRVYLQEQKSLGKLAVRDAECAAGMLISMLVGGVALRTTLGLATKTRSKEDQLKLAACLVDLFLQSECA